MFKPLHKFTLALGVVFAALVPALAGTIYKTVDAQGNVEYTDRKPLNDSNVVEVEAVSANTYGATQARVAAPEPYSEPAPEELEQPQASYASLVILAPADNATLRSNEGIVNVRSELLPGLAAGHTGELVLDGAIHQTQPSVQFSLANIDRGTHTIEIRVRDTEGTIVRSSPTHTFHLQRTSVLQPGRAPSVSN